MAMMGMRGEPGRPASHFRIARVASTPLITGIRTSMSTASPFPAVTAATAFRPFSADVTTMPAFSRISVVMRRLMAWSSARMIRIRENRASVARGSEGGVPPSVKPKATRTASRSGSGWTGLVNHAAGAAPSPARPPSAMAMIRALGHRLRGSGISVFHRIRSKGASAGGSPPPSTRKPMAESSRRIARRATGSHPITSARRFRSSAGRRGGSAPWGSRVRRAVKVKALPAPGRLATRIRPPMSPTIRLQMASPRPVPPYWRVIPPSAWVKASKSFARWSDSMPIPVSRTPTARVRPGSASSDSGAVRVRRTQTTTRPRSVNLKALEIRFIRTWRRRNGSPIRPSGTDGWTSITISTGRSEFRSPNISQVSPTISRREKGISSMSRRPASILEKSRMSLMRWSRDRPEVWMISRYSRCRGCGSAPRASSQAPMIPFMGVRISWLMLARNSLLDRLAASADRARFRAWRMASASRWLACRRASVRSATRRSSSSLTV